MWGIHWRKGNKEMKGFHLGDELNSKQLPYKRKQRNRVLISRYKGIWPEKMTGEDERWPEKMAEKEETRKEETSGIKNHLIP